MPIEGEVTQRSGPVDIRGMSYLSLDVRFAHASRLEHRCQAMSGSVFLVASPTRDGGR